MFFSAFASFDFYSILPMCENCDYQQDRKCPPLCLDAHFSIHKTEISGVPFVQITESQNSVSTKGPRWINQVQLLTEQPIGGLSPCPWH